MNDLADTRAALAASLDVVLPGRVLRYPPTTKRWSTPSIFIEQPGIIPTDVGWTASFPVWVVVDGAIDAQVALLDDLTQNAWLAVRPIADEVTVTPQLVAGFRAAVLDVLVMLDVETMCSPEAAEVALIPPVLAG